MIGRTILMFLVGAAMVVALSPARVSATEMDNHGHCKNCQKPGSKSRAHACGTVNCDMQCCRVISVATQDILHIVVSLAPRPTVQLATTILNNIAVPDSIFHPPRA